MMLHIALVYLSFVNISLGQATTTSTCVTRYTNKSVQPSSTGITKTKSSTFKETITTTRTSTFTPKPVTSTTTTTSTVVSTTTVRSTSTVGLTSVTFVTTTGTETDTATSTVTVETTTTPPASTVPTSAGFTPLAGASGYVAKRSLGEERSPELHGKINARAPAPSSRVKISQSKGAVVFAPKVYPKSTICTTVIKASTTITKTSTARGIVTTTAPASTEIVTSTTTTTSTSTVVGNPTYSLSITVSTSTVTNTVATTTTTATTTETAYVEAPTQTVYAQCASNNLITTSNGGQPIRGISVDAGNVDYMGVVGGVPDANACCEQCAMTSNCVGYYFALGSECYYFITTDGTCSGDQGLLSYTTSADDNTITIGDGACGYYVDKGSG